ncbi:hypothetical protein ES707_09784 [subsurface metagenome]
MQGEQEIRSLKEELEKLTGFIGENGSADQTGTKDYFFGCDVCDALSWVLELISTNHFRSHNHLNIDQLNEIARDIETTTGKEFASYE